MDQKLVVKLDEAASGFYPGLQGGGTTLRFLIDKETSGAELFAMLGNSIAPGTQTGAGTHQHPTEHGFFILRGKAQFVIGGTEYVVGPMTSVFIPANVPHLVTNIGDESLDYLVMYAPQGPEQDLRRRFLNKKA